MRLVDAAARMIGFLIRNAVAIVGALWLGIVGAAGMYWWDRRPEGTPSVHVHVIFGCCTWTAPDSLGAQLARLKLAEKAAAAKAARIEAQSAAVTHQVGAEHEQSMTRLRFVTHTIIREIPLVVTPAIDRDLPLSVGFVRAHDAAAWGVDLSAVPNPAGQPDDAASVVTPSSLAAIVAANYGGRCRADAQTLSDLQAWVRQERALNP